jgi:hypothetical protein
MWKDDSAEVLVVSERPFQQSRRGVLEQGIDWACAAMLTVIPVGESPIGGNAQVPP